MKICVSATANCRDAQIDRGFWPGPYSLGVNLVAMQFKAIPKEAINEIGDKGIQAPQAIPNKRAKVLKATKIVSNGFRTLSVKEIQMLIGISGAVREVQKKYEKVNLNCPPRQHLR